jgi:hypothetical protein
MTMGSGSPAVVLAAVHTFLTLATGLLGSKGLGKVQGQTPSRRANRRRTISAANGLSGIVLALRYLALGRGRAAIQVNMLPPGAR